MTPNPRDRLAGALAVYPRKADLPVRAGVTARQLANAEMARPVATIPYLRLCMTIGYDPLPGFLLVTPQEPRDFEFHYFALAFKVIRGVKRHTHRQAAREIDVSASTVCRIERGDAMFIGVVLRACNYMAKHAFLFCTAENQKKSNPSPNSTSKAIVSRENREVSTS
jgi:hypothetical protein